MSIDRLIITFLLLPSLIVIVKSDQTHDFIGSHHWNATYRDSCTNPPIHHSNHLDCYIKYVHFEAIRIEVLNRSPLLIYFYQLISRTHADRLIVDINRRTLDEQMVVSDRSVLESMLSDSRRANGTWFEHDATPIFNRTFNRFQRILSPIDLHFAEQWHVFSYEPGGHYAPHYDYLQRAHDNEYDHWMSNYGNRLATLFLVIETAKQGGGLCTILLPINISF
jgi:hypothetical protein